MATRRKTDLDFGKSNLLDLSNPNMYWGQVLVDGRSDINGAGVCKVYIRALDRHLLNRGVKPNTEKVIKNKQSKAFEENPYEWMNENPTKYSELVDVLPDCLPMMPKHFSSPPKQFETVLVIIGERNNPRLYRYYLGPFISQPQFLDYDGALPGILAGKSGSAQGLFDYKKSWWSVNGSRLNGKDSTSNWNVYETGHPQDPCYVSINGRGNNDITLKNSDGSFDEVLLRVNKYKLNSNQEKIVNKKNPGYISLVSYDLGKGDNTKTSVNIVADNINLVSYKGSPTKGIPNKSSGAILNSSEPSKQINLENTNLHPIVYGDILWDILNKLKIWVQNHKHEGGGVAYTKPSEDTETTELLNELEKALGDQPPTKEKSENGEEYKIYGGTLISNNIKIN